MPTNGLHIITQYNPIMENSGLPSRHAVRLSENPTFNAIDSIIRTFENVRHHTIRKTSSHFKANATVSFLGIGAFLFIFILPKYSYIFQLNSLYGSDEVRIAQAIN
jgi:hypothetical protein